MADGEYVDLHLLWEQVIQNVKSRPMLVYARDTMIALNRKESENIQVEVL